MAIKIIAKVRCNTKEFPYNKGKKPPELKLNSKLIANRYDALGVVVLKPVLDRLKFGFFINEQFMGKFGGANDLDEFLTCIKANLFHEAKVNTESHGLSPATGKWFNKPPYCHYNVNLHWRPKCSNTRVLVQVGPKLPGKPFMRFDMKVSELGSGGIKEFRSFVEDTVMMPGVTITYDNVMNSAVIYQAEIAVDVLGARPSDLEAVLLKGKKPVKVKSHLYKSAGGRTETVYFNAKPEKSCMEYLYDKRQQLLEEKGIPTYGEALHSRLEWRVQKKTFAELKKLQNRCSRLSVRVLNYQMFHKLSPYQSLFMRHVMECRSLSKALKGVPQHRHKLLSKCSDVSLAPIWDAKKLWDYWGEYTTQSELFPKCT